MPWLHNAVYLVLLVLLAPWLLAQAIRRGKYRQGLAAKLLGRVPIRRGQRPCIWLHAVSVGEVNLLTELVKQIETVLPQVECAVSTTTRTGYQLARRRWPDRFVFYCPLDFSWATRRAMRRIRPEVLVLAELELWPNLIRAAGVHGAKVAVVNGRLSDRSFRGYCRLRTLVRGMFRRLELIAAQSEQYADRFVQLGAPAASVHVTGSLKFDGVTGDRDDLRVRQLASLAGFDSEDRVLLAGSTQEGEEALALEAFGRLAGPFPQLRLVLVPRHPERFAEVGELLDASGVPWQLRSQLDEHSQMRYALANRAAPRVLLVDTVGELAAWWGTAHFAYVGGSQGRREGQNMIEPAAYGAAVCFGPRTRNFRDVVQLLLAEQAAEVVHDASELAVFVRRLLDNPTGAAAMGERARQLVAGQRGATQRTVDLLAKLIEPSCPSCRQPRRAA